MVSSNLVFFIVPISHEESTARRWPIVSIVLILLNVLVFAWQLSNTEAEDRANHELAVMVKYLKEKPYLADPKCHSIAFVNDRPRLRPPPELEEAQRAEEQAKLESLCAEVDRAVFAMPTFKYGDIPGRPKLLTLFTCQFLHGGFLHLLFNMWFLWLAACNLEDRWGRPIFLAFYLLSGVAAALLHRAMNPAAFIPAIGASGAIAGAMGGFLVILWATKIRFFYLFFFFVRLKVGTFEAPAYVMLPLWFAIEVLEGLFLRGDGTAHWAHVGGFAFGAGVAAALKLSGLDKKLDANIEKKASVSQDPRLLEASRLVDDGHMARGLAALQSLASEQPTNIDVRLELLRASALAADHDLRARTLVEIGLLHVDAGAFDACADIVRELQQLGLGPRAPQDRLLRLGERLAQRGAPAIAGQCFICMYKDGFRSEWAQRAAVSHAAVLLRTGLFDQARRVLEAARDEGAAAPDIASKIDAQLAQISARAESSARGL